MAAVTSDSAPSEVPKSSASQAEPNVAEYEAQPETWRDTVVRLMPPGVSLLVHTVIFLLLAVVTYEETSKEVARFIVVPPPEKEEDPPVEVELDPEIDVVLDNIALFNAAPAPASAAASANMPTLDQSLLAKADTSQLNIATPTIGIPDSVALIEAVPDGDVKGEARDIVDSYQQALDRLAQELIWMLDESPVLVVWCFDQSESMKDDQQEIRDRIETVYEQLGLVGRTNNKASLTAVTSYGENFVDHTLHKPTSDRTKIRAAIDEIPVDKTGKELMSSAVGRAIGTYRDLARRGRQMAMVLVSDETGDRQNNDGYLEQAISVAKAAKCKVYVLGRESVFGYPYAFFRWQHPQTNRIHWLPMDRGPETAFPEQLQTNGFRRRHDAFSSGFGSYEQARLARETNGIFFMLPSVESNLVGSYKERYELEALRPYRPDLRAKMEVLSDRDEFPLRTLIWQVIQDLNPYVKGTQKAVEMRMEFSLNPPEFLQQARREQEKAKMHLRYMAEAEQRLLDGEHLREQEADPRWQANYDIILAQLIAYQARIYEYGVALDAFIQKPHEAAPTKGNRRLVHWDIRTVKKLRTEEAKPYVERANERFAQIKQDHPGSPWAARANWEMRRGFGVDLAPEYRIPYKQVSNPMKPPKL
ncbi:MAG: vWA domain-containing protein [Rubripirellula sp.]